MDATLRKAVAQGEVEGVRRALAEMEQGTLGRTDDRKHNVLHMAAQWRHYTSAAVLELLVEAMDEEQVSARTSNGDTVIHFLLAMNHRRAKVRPGVKALKPSVSFEQWLLDVRGVTAALVRKMTEAALFDKQGTRSPSVCWLCQGLQIPAL
mmetsp:Transcript_4588/g.16144  ORF Transcript_4588/g.16144 Transcript_4588/m.16144 type:complete len:151 (-) Transcript_4588:9-461(-)